MRQWLQPLFARNTSRARRHPRFRPGLEPLEERLALTTFPVVNLNDAGDGSLRKAIADANARGGADDITFQPGLTGTITLTGGPLAVTDGLTIHGPGAQVLTVSGNHASRIFDIVDSAPGASMAVAIGGLTVKDGQDAGVGGAIRTVENLTLTQCTLTGNSARDGGALYVGDGTATLTNCTLSGNTASRNGGGCWFGSFSGSLTSCTLSGNSALQGGGAMITGTATLSNCTLSGNSATSQGGGLFNWGKMTINS
jgi:hypothetical protein